MISRLAQRTDSWPKTGLNHLFRLAETRFVKYWTCYSVSKKPMARYGDIGHAWAQRMCALNQQKQQLKETSWNETGFGGNWCLFQYLSMSINEVSDSVQAISTIASFIAPLKCGDILENAYTINTFESLINYNFITVVLLLVLSMSQYN